MAMDPKVITVNGTPYNVISIDTNVSSPYQKHYAIGLTEKKNSPATPFDLYERVYIGSGPYSYTLKNRDGTTASDFCLVKFDYENGYRTEPGYVPKN
jgi:hypothetical protein